MTLPELCIRRPVFTTMLIVFPVVVGLISYFKMGVDLFPNVDLPIVTVSTTRPGTPQDVAELVHFLCTAGTYITGQVVRLDGGRSIT